MRYLKQDGYDIRCEWGLHGIETLRDDSDVIVIVDVLSFSTAVDIAVGRQCLVYPYRYTEDAAAFAESHGAILAQKRASAGGFSLSPGSLQTLPLNSKLVLPSPNGSTLSLATGDKITIAGCLRNAQAVANAAARFGRRITVIPAGERWSDGSLRPAVEDWIGAGAILSFLDGKCSPEAALAKTTFLSLQNQITDMLRDCISGVELYEKSHPDDVTLASMFNVSRSVPVLQHGVYIDSKI